MLGSDKSDSDSDFSDHKQMEFLEMIMTTWIKYEDPALLQDIGMSEIGQVSDSSLEELEEEVSSDDIEELIVDLESLPGLLADNFSHTVENEGMYYFLLLNCDNHAM